MTTELTKAAQQALEALKKKHGHWGPGHDQLNAEAIAALERAITQRPAAQEVCAHVLYTTQDTDRPDAICDRNGEVVLSMCKLCGKAESELPAPQQATPEPGDDAQIRAIGEGLRSAHDHIEMHRLERSHCKDAERIREGLAAFSAYKKRGDFAATPEPVGEPVAWLRQAKQGPGVHDPLVILGAARPTGYVAAYRPVAYCDAHPAPGVPVGFALVPLKATPKIAMVIYEGARKCFSPKVAEGLWRDALAAAQAKGGE